MITKSSGPDLLTESNLAKITRRLLDAYKSRDALFLRYLLNKLRPVTGFTDQGIQKNFAQLVMLFHPDRLIAYQQQSEAAPGKAMVAECISLALKYLHAEPHRKYLQEIQAQSTSKDFGQAVDVDEFDAVVDPADGEDVGTAEERFGQELSFLEALKWREFGIGDAYLAEYHLNSLTGMLNLSACGMQNLEGLRHCYNLSSLDVSNNELTNCLEVGFLSGLKEVYLARNYLSDLEGLQELQYLDMLDVAFNQLSDLQPLMCLRRLKYVNVSGNPLTTRQVNALRQHVPLVLF